MVAIISLQTHIHYSRSDSAGVRTLPCALLHAVRIPVSD